MFDIENDLPDELIGPSWGLSDSMGNTKPPAQGPGPGSGLQNGIDGPDNQNVLRQQMQINHHMLQVSIFSPEEN